MYLNQSSKLKTASAQLNEIQSWMQTQLLHPSELTKEETETYIKPSSKLTARQHLAIYQRSYIARLRACMQAQYTGLSYALGPQIFDQFTDFYLNNHPSKSYTLGDLGDQYAHFLAETRPDKDETVKETWPDFMIELAEFEYLINDAFDQKSNEDIELVKTENTDQEFKLLPIFHILTYQFPISVFYKAVINNHQPELPQMQTSYTILLRKNYQLGLFEINEGQYHFLKHFESNNSVDAAKNYMVNHFGIPAKKMDLFWKEWRQAWIEQGFFQVNL